MMRKISWTWMVSVVVGSVSAVGLEDLKPLTDWEACAAGVWRGTIGDMTEEVRYNDLASQSPRL